MNCSLRKLSGGLTMYTHFGCERWQQAAAFALRYDVFVLEQGISLQDEFDELDTPERNYFVVYEGDLAVATIRYQEKDAQAIQPDRFCVHKKYRKMGIGKELLTRLEKHALDAGYRFSVLSAEISALPFYESLHYAVSSTEYLEDGILCVEMTKNLSHPTS